MAIAVVLFLAVTRQLPAAMEEHIVDTRQTKAAHMHCDMSSKAATNYFVEVTAAPPTRNTLYVFSLCVHVFAPKVVSDAGPFKDRYLPVVSVYAPCIEYRKSRFRIKVLNL